MRTQIGRIMFSAIAIAVAPVASAAPVAVSDTVCSSPCADVWAPGTGPAADAADDALYLSGIEYQ